MKKLPDDFDWAVKNDGSQLFKDTVLKYISENYERDWVGNMMGGYYGVRKGVSLVSDNPLKRDMEVVALIEFIALTKDDFKMGDMVEVRDEGYFNWAKRLFAFEKDGFYWCIKNRYEEKFKNNDLISVSIIRWNKIRPVSPPACKSRLEILEDQIQEIKKEIIGMKEGRE